MTKLIFFCQSQRYLPAIFFLQPWCLPPSRRPSSVQRSAFVSTNSSCLEEIGLEGEKQGKKMMNLGWILVTCCSPANLLVVFGWKNQRVLTVFDALFTPFWPVEVGWSSDPTHSFDPPGLSRCTWSNRSLGWDWWSDNMTASLKDESWQHAYYEHLTN